MPDPDPLLENARLAAACGAEPAMILAAALATMAPASVREGVELLAARVDELEQIVARGPGDQMRRPAPLEPRLQFDQEVGRIRKDLGDHEIRGKLLFRDLVGQRSFFQVAAWTIAGLDLAASDAALLEQLGVNTQLIDAQIWPLAVARRIASLDLGLAHALIGGLATLCTPAITVQPVASFMRFLDRVDARVRAGASLGSVVDDILASGERISGFGRPVLGPDERVPHAFDLAVRYGRDSGPSVRLAREIARLLHERKALRINSAGVQAAIMRDLGFTPNAASAFCVLYFVVPIVTQAVYSRPGARR